MTTKPVTVDGKIFAAGTKATLEERLTYDTDPDLSVACLWFLVGDFKVLDPEEG